MRYFATFGIIGLSLLSIFGCKKDNTESENYDTDTTFVIFEDVDNYGFFAVTEKGTAVIKTETEWLNLWELYWSHLDNNFNKTPPPEVNFDEKIVIGVFWGNDCSYSGCTNESPSIETVFITTDTIYVNIGEIVDLGPCAACVYPLHLIEIEKQDLPIKFIGSTP